MTRSTSIEAYNAVIESGHVGRRQKELYKILYEQGPMTAGEAIKKLSEIKSEFKFDSNTHTRFTEMRNADIIMEVGTRSCAITGRRCILWDVTDNHPVKPEKRKTKDQIIAGLIKENSQLKSTIKDLMELKSKQTSFSF